MPLTVNDFKLKNKGLVTTDKKIIIAYSGGLDSSVLLHLMGRIFSSQQILIWHINHQLQDAADDMELFCTDQAEQYGLSFKVSRLDLSHVSNNIEAQARTARYAEFVKHSNSKKDVLLTAHHADDQIETLLLNILRGSGVSGLRGIASDIWLEQLHCQRPLLQFSREDIKSYALEHKLKWIEDPSNQLINFDRNYIRHEISSKIKARWPNAQRSFLQVADHQKEAAECLSDLAANDMNEAIATSLFSAQKVINISALKLLSNARQKNLIRHWLMMYEFNISFHNINSLIGLIERFKFESKKLQLGDSFIALYRDEMFLVKNIEMLSPEQIKTNLRQLKGIFVGRMNYRQLGFTTHFLKNQFQARAVPPWLREQTVLHLESIETKKVIGSIQF